MHIASQHGRRAEGSLNDDVNIVGDGAGDRLSDGGDSSDHTDSYDGSHSGDNGGAAESSQKRSNVEKKTCPKCTITASTKQNAQRHFQQRMSPESSHNSTDPSRCEGSRSLPRLSRSIS